MLGILSSYNKPTRVLKRCVFLESAGHEVVVAYAWLCLVHLSVSRKAQKEQHIVELTE